MEFFRKNTLQKVLYDLKDLAYQNKMTLEDIIVKSGLDMKSIKFISIGANDGIKSDPVAPFIRTHDWKGIFIEPVHDYFRDLEENYKNNRNIIFENIAIGEYET